MLTGFPSRVRVHNVSTSGRLGGVVRQLIGGIHALEHAFQVGVRELQGSQLTIAQCHQFHGPTTRRVALHTGIIDHGVQVINVDDAFKFTPHQDGHVGIQGRSELDPQTQVDKSIKTQLKRKKMYFFS